MPILGAIWGLADTDADGKMNINEFSIACKLINLKLRGFDIPQVLPPSLQHLAQQPGSVTAAPMRPPVPTSPLIAGVPQAPRPTMISPPSGGGTPISQPLVGLQMSRPHPTIPPQPVLAPQPMIPPLPSQPMIPPLPAQPLISPRPAIPPLPSQPIIPPLPAQPAVVSQTLLGMSAPLSMAPMPPIANVPPMASVPPLAMVHPTSVPQVPLTQAPSIPPFVNPVAPTQAAVSADMPMERTYSLESPLGSSSQFVEWAVPHASKLKYTQLFNTTDRTRSGFLNGVQARNIMMASQLPQTVLAQIWGLSDMDSDGRLSCEEFVLAMHLCDLARSGDKIPVPLPSDLVPPSLRRQRQNSLSSNPEAGDPLAGMSGVSFEDKRKENYEKGQAELERRRKTLLEIQRKEQEERERKEREEQEKREKIRLEQERRRQEELERQLMAQRELEMQKEEERKRAQEQRDAARREMERQRQLEWEKQRSQELQAQRQREQENVLRMKAKNQNLGIELSQLNEKVKELSTKITDTRSGVTGVKSTIDGMRTTRDTQLQQMSMLKAKLKEQNARLVAVSQEKARLEAKNKINSASDAAGQENAKLAFQNKQITLKQLRDKLADMETQIGSKKEDIENNNSQLGDMKKKLLTLVKDCEEIYQTYDEKRNKVLEMKGTKGNVDWGDDAWNSTPAAWPEENTFASQIGYKRYRALYEFSSRNPDELTFQPGDIIMVSVTQNAEPGWLSGELRGASGWFPEAYVECIDLDDSGYGTGYTEADTLQKTQLEEIAEVPENVSDSGSMESATELAPPVPKMPSLVLGLGTPADLTVVAVHTFPATSLGQLPFARGDIIRVTENQDIWWYGENNGQEGWFPKSYVKLSTDNININNTVDTGMLPPDEQEYYVALYPYATEELGDLTFGQGEVILVVKKDGEWWTGVIADKTGIFPSNYVQKADTQPVVQQAIEEPVVKASQPVVQLEAQPQIQRAITPDFSALQSQFESTSSGGEDSDAKGSKGKKPEIATVIAPYQASSSEQLSLQRGQLIMIRKKTTTGWWEGELQAKGKKRQVGWFPASYVKTLGAGAGKGGRSGRQTPSAEPLSTERVIALYQYKALNEDELNFEKDDIISILSKDEPDWWRGELNGMMGLFPSNYVAPL